MPALGTPYLRTQHSLKVTKSLPDTPLVFRLRPAAVVEVTVVDADTGRALADVDLWREETVSPPSKPQVSIVRRNLYSYYMHEAETHINHVIRPRTSAKGKLKANFEPGKHRIGVGLRSLPPGYEAVEVDGKEINVEAGKTIQATFHLRKRE